MTTNTSRRTPPKIEEPVIAGQQRAAPVAVLPSPHGRLWACPECGGSVTNTQRVRCEDCIDADPRQTAEARGRRAKAIAARHTRASAWEAAGGVGTFDPDAWATIQQGLRDVKLSDIVDATGLSKSFASVVRAGKSRPHPSLWPSLANLGSATPAPELVPLSAEPNPTECARS